MDIKTTAGKIISKTGEGESLKDAVIRLIANHANLRGANLRGADLLGANLRWANLSVADLREANLSEANLSGADLRWANLSGADLLGANLSWANLRGANLSVADLREANLSEADLRGADLSGANLSGTKQRIVIIQAVRHQIVAIDDDVRIGCRRKKLSDWLASYESVGRNEGYTEDEISLYGRLLKSLEE